MRRVKRSRFSKRAITLIELVVAMTLTALFASACIMLILPIEQIYRHTTELSRAQILADTIVDSLRAECSHTYIENPSDVWISSDGAGGMTDGSAPGYYDGGGASFGAYGNVLVIRRSEVYCETIAANYAITTAMYTGVLANDETNPPQTNVNSITSRNVYRLFPDGRDIPGLGTAEGFVHFGYYRHGYTSSGVVFPQEYYDYTNPVSIDTYGDFQVKLVFGDIGLSGGKPAFVECEVIILRDGVQVYSRTAVLCFASPVN